MLYTQDLDYLRDCAMRGIETSQYDYEDYLREIEQDSDFDSDELGSVEP